MDWRWRGRYESPCARLDDNRAKRNDFTRRSSLLQIAERKMSGDQQHQIIDTIARRFQQARQQFRRTHFQLGVLMIAKRPGTGNHNQNQNHVSQSLETSHANAPEETGTKQRRNNIGRRKSFAVSQLLGLEFHYSQSRYLRGTQLNMVSQQLRLTNDQVKIWFQNRRAKENRHRKLMTKKADKIGDGSGIEGLQIMKPTTPPPPPLMLPPNLELLQQQPSTSHSYCHLHMPITSSLLLGDTCLFTETQSQKHIDIVEQASSHSIDCS